MSKVKTSDETKKKGKEFDDLSALSLRNLGLIFATFWEVCFLITGIQLLYCIIVGNFPMNSFLSGVFSSLGSLIITVCLRFQINKETRYMNLTAERAIWEYLFCMLILFLVCVNFLG